MYILTDEQKFIDINSILLMYIEECVIDNDHREWKVMGKSPGSDIRFCSCETEQDAKDTIKRIFEMAKQDKDYINFG